MTLSVGAKSDKSLRPDEWKKVRYAKDEVLPDAKIDEGKAIVRVRVLGYKPETKMSLLVGFTPLDAAHQYEGSFPFADDGTVEAQVPVRLTRQVFVLVPELESPFSRVLIAPGEVSEILVDPETAGCPFVDFRGYMARTNKECSEDFWATMQNRKANDQQLYDELRVLKTPEQRVKFFKDRLEAKKKDINKRRLTSASKALSIVQ